MNSFRVGPAVGRPPPHRHGGAYKKEFTRCSYQGICHIYHEDLVKCKDSITSKTYDGLPHYGTDTAPFHNDYPLKLISYRLTHQSMTRTARNRWILEVLPENYILLNPKDAGRYGIKTGDTVKVQSRHSAVVGRAMVRQGIMPGVVGVPYGYGNRE